METMNFLLGFLHYSNTTLVKVKSHRNSIITAIILHSNTTLVKVKLYGMFNFSAKERAFKYNTC